MRHQVPGKVCSLWLPCIFVAEIYIMPSAHAVWCTGVSDCTPTTDGTQYLGYTSVTASGIVCQAWSSQSPHAHLNTQGYMYPDGSVSAASNYCRNPDDYVGLWCYTTSSATRWEYCDVPLCDGW